MHSLNKRKFNTLKAKVSNFDRRNPAATTLIHINQYNTSKQTLEKEIGSVDRKLPDISDLVTTTVFSTEISEVENKILDTSSLVTTMFLIQKLVKLRIKFLIRLNILLLKNVMS